MKYIFYQDGGHGWLAVTMAELKMMGIEDMITGHSYRRKSTAYLEEDCDLQTFLKAKGLKGEGLEKFWKEDTITRFVGTGYGIRNLPGYTV